MEGMINTTIDDYAIAILRDAVRKHKILHYNYCAADGIASVRIVAAEGTKERSFDISNRLFLVDLINFIDEFSMRVSKISPAEFEYLRNDVIATKDLFNSLYGLSNSTSPNSVLRMIDRVIFNKPATIVLWKDGTKTVVKCQKGDHYNKETGLALCCLKKVCDGSSRKLHDILKLAEEGTDNGSNTAHKK